MVRIALGNWDEYTELCNKSTYTRRSIEVARL